VCDFEWSPTNDKLLAAITIDGLRLYTIEEDQVEYDLFTIEKPTSLSFSPDGNLIAVTSCIDNDTENLTGCHGILSIFELETESWSEIARFDYGLDNVKFS
jgi:WD40 repeat protein